MSSTKPPPVTINVTGLPGNTAHHAAAAPALDPVVAAKLSMFQSIYTDLWGEPATEGYLKGAVQAGLNSWEFIDHERAKPAFAKTKSYEDRAKSAADALLNLGA